MKKSVLIVYHFFYPDDVVSSRHFSDLAVGLASRGWDVSVLTSNRFCREPGLRIKQTDEQWKSICIHRSRRPEFIQASNFGRLLNAFWLMAKWIKYVFSMPAYDSIILGTDPQFGYLMLPFFRLRSNRTKLVHWGFDLYPEAIIAENSGLLSSLAKVARPVTSFCYSVLDGMVDIGPCMRLVLDGYRHGAARATLVPWALVEPDRPLEPDPETRRQLFGNAKLALLYSGTIGKAHDFDAFLELARELRRRGASVAFCFAGRGNRYDELRAKVSDADTNVSFAGFANEEQLGKRLGAGDLHLISLQPGWEGIVLPSKFFGSLASGKPLLYAGTPKSSVKGWIDQYRIGFCIEKGNLTVIADILCRIAEDRSLLSETQDNAFRCYREHFAREKVLDEWDQFLKSLFDRSNIRSFDKNIVGSVRAYSHSRSAINSRE